MCRAGTGRSRAEEAADLGPVVLAGYANQAWTRNMTAMARKNPAVAFWDGVRATRSGEGLLSTSFSGGQLWSWPAALSITASRSAVAPTGTAYECGSRGRDIPASVVRVLVVDGLTATETIRAGSTRRR